MHSHAEFLHHPYTRTSPPTASGSTQLPSRLRVARLTVRTGTRTTLKAQSYFSLAIGLLRIIPQSGSHARALQACSSGLQLGAGRSYDQYLIVSRARQAPLPCAPGARPRRALRKHTYESKHSSEAVERMLRDQVQKIRGTDLLLSGLCHPCPEMRSLARRSHGTRSPRPLEAYLLGVPFSRCS